ncbi:hypothetical protein Poly30_05980 [Planctomycetes bacterium Poly30]|uniref:Alpha/beta hydrolase family protein n=1 Tax=Saltatorellus ferox TaxID=2528018 RepID=A0A518ELY4_9BACT|nr:hypothetical protein Poly30_05980 [Planctomycetes bacterium Poly30]
MILLSTLSLLGPIALAAAPALPQVKPLTKQQAPTVASLGGDLVTPFLAPMTGSAVSGRMLQITLNLPGQTWQETFIVGIPSNMQTPAPVLTLFHGYGEEPVNVLQNTTLAADAMARGWLVFIPLGAHKYNYGIDYAQENIELAFEFFASRLPVDMDRVYGVGFSMGGGAAASYAARHLDPNGIQFAAIVNHTGTTSLRATYQTSNDYNLFQSPLMFGGTPDSDPFRYLRSSTVDMDMVAGTVDLRGALSSNLSHVPVRHWYATMDVNATIVEQTLALDQAMSQEGSDTGVVPRPYAIHSWSTLDNTVVLDWLEGQRLTRPAAGEVTKTVADRDGRWHDLDIRQVAGDELTPILWSVQAQANALYLIDSKNLAEVAIDAPAAGLDMSRNLLVVFQIKDSSVTDIVLRGVDQMPTNVIRRGTATPPWTYDATEKTLTLHELNGIAGWSSWIIVP